MCALFITAKIEKFITVTDNAFPLLFKQGFKLCHILYDNDVDHHERAVAVFARKYQLEPTHYLRIVYQYEKDVDERQQPSDRGDEDVDRLRQQRSPLGDLCM